MIPRLLTSISSREEAAQELALSGRRPSLHRAFPARSCGSHRLTPQPGDENHFQHQDVSHYHCHYQRCHYQRCHYQRCRIKRCLSTGEWQKKLPPLSRVSGSLRAGWRLAGQRGVACAERDWYRVLPAKWKEL